jgi:two-component system phosphate regulon sensor histidine kinase PhoR
MKGEKHVRRLSLKWRFTIGLAALLVLTVSALSWLVLRQIKQDQLQNIENDLKQRSDLASLRVRQTYLSGSAADDVPTFLRRRGTELAADLSALLSGARVMLYDAEGKEVGNSMPLSQGPDVKDIMVYATQGKIVYEQYGDSLLYLAPMTWSVGQVGIVQLQISLKSEHAFYSSIAYSLRNIGLTSLVVSFLLGFLYVQRVTSSLSKLKVAVDQIRDGSFLKESPVTRRDEIGELSEGITYMSREIEQSLARQKQFIGNVSHEFKTPLTSVIAFSDLLDMYRDDPVLLNEARANIRQESGRLLEMVEKVLHLSEMEQYEFSLNAERVDVKEALAEVCGRLTGKAIQFQLTVETDLHAAIIKADRESLIHIFLNLLDNAIKYNVPGGSIHVSCRTEADKAVIVFRDTGIGIPIEARGKLFEPFYTVSKDRARLTGGTGLGLSLVKRLVELQQGQVVFAALPAGRQGSQFTVTFPLIK